MASITTQKNCLIILLSLNILYSCASLNTFTFNPTEPLCVGEQVVMKCTIDLSPSALYMDISSPYISIDGSSPISIDRFGELATMDIDITRYTANFVTNSQDEISALITVSGYSPIDSATVFGCHGLFINSSFSPALASGSPTGALTPDPPSLTDTSLSIDPNTCETVVNTYLLPPANSNRAIDSYDLYINMELVLTVDSSFNDKQEINTKLILNTEHTLSVVAMNCAGKSPLYTQELAKLPSYLFKPDSLDFTINSQNQLLITWQLTADNMYEIIMSYQMELTLRNIPVGHPLEPSHEFILKSEFSLPSTQNSYAVDLSVLNTISLHLNISVTLQILSRCEYNATGPNKMVKGKQYDVQLNTDSVLSEQSQSLPVYGTVVIAILAIALVGCFMLNIIFITFLIIKSFKPNSKAENTQIMVMHEKDSTRKDPKKQTIEEANQLYASPEYTDDNTDNRLSDSDYSTIK